MKASIIIINYNTWQMTQKAIRALESAEKGLNFEIILIDNGSEEKIGKASAEQSGVKVFIANEENLGFAKAVNQGIKISQGDFIFLLNSDVLIEDEAISKMIGYMENNPEVGIVGPRLIYPNGKFQISAGRFPSFFKELIRLSLLYKILPFQISYADDGRIIREVDWLSGGAMLVRRKAIDAIGQFDEKYFFGYEDVDFCFRAKKGGWKAVYHPLVQAIHHHGFSSGGKRSVFRASQERDGLIYFFKKNIPQSNFNYGVIRAIYDMKIFIFKIFGL